MRFYLFFLKFSFEIQEFLRFYFFGNFYWKIENKYFPYPNSKKILKSPESLLCLVKISILDFSSFLIFLT